MTSRATKFPELSIIEHKLILEIRIILGEQINLLGKAIYCSDCTKLSIGSLLWCTQCSRLRKNCRQVRRLAGNIAHVPFSMVSSLYRRQFSSFSVQAFSASTNANNLYFDDFWLVFAIV